MLHVVLRASSCVVACFLDIGIDCLCFMCYVIIRVSGIVPFDSVCVLCRKPCSVFLVVLQCLCLCDVLLACVALFMRCVMFVIVVVYMRRMLCCMYCCVLPHMLCGVLSCCVGVVCWCVLLHCVCVMLFVVCMCALVMLLCMCAMFVVLHVLNVVLCVA